MIQNLIMIQMNQTVILFPKIFKFHEKSLSHKLIFIDVRINDVRIKESHGLAQILIRISLSDLVVLNPVYDSLYCIGDII